MGWNKTGNIRGPAPPLSAATPQPLGTASAGTSANASRDDHVHSSHMTALQVGAGAMRGTDYINVARTSVVAAMTANAYTDLPFNNVTSTLTPDDGSMYSSPNFISQAAGFYSGIATGSFSVICQKYMRWITQGGSVLSLIDSTVGGTFSCPVAVILPGGGYTIKAQVNSTQACNLSISTATAPSSAYMAQVE